MSVTCLNHWALGPAHYTPSNEKAASGIRTGQHWRQPSMSAENGKLRS